MSTSNPYKALQAIEILVGGDLGTDIEWWLADKQKRKHDKMKLEMAKLIGQIYKIAHSEGRCRGHDDWEQIKHQIVKMEAK